jgi:protease-4
MRILVALIVNLFLLLRTALLLPVRSLRSRHRRPYVRFVLREDPPYRELPRRRWRLFSKRDPAAVRSIAELRQQLATLGQDERVRGAVFKVEGLHIAAAKVDAIVELFDELRARGKEVIGYAVHAGNAEYEVLCAADRIIFSPPGRLDLTGFAAEATALGAGLRRIGVSAQFIRRGEYKTAPELFTEAEVSDIHRRTVEHLLDRRYEVLISRIARGRRLSVEEARRKVDAGPYSARRARAEGLCDALCSEADLGQFLDPAVRKAGNEEDSERRLPHFGAYRRTLAAAPVPWRSFKRRPRVLVVPLRGIIAEGEGGRMPIGPEIAGSDTLVTSMRSAGRDPGSAAILLYVNSPGGSALASELILDEVRRAAQKKPVVAYFDRVAASGGYMAALGASEIWAAPEAIAGSIGVFGGKFELSRLLEVIGVRRTVIARGESSGLFSPSRPFTEPERRTMEAEIEEAYQDFLELVSVARGKSKEEIHSRAEGRVYSGAEAVEAGLIDRIGSFEGACRRALELAKVPSDRFDVAVHPAGKRRVPMIRLMREAQRTGVFALWLPGVETLDFAGGDASLDDARDGSLDFSLARYARDQRFEDVAP